MTVDVSVVNTSNHYVSMFVYHNLSCISCFPSMIYDMDECGLLLSCVIYQFSCVGQDKSVELVGYITGGAYG